MEKPITNESLKRLLNILGFVVVLGLGYMTYQSYASCERSKADLKSTTGQRDTLKTQITETKASIGKLKKERDEFAKVLFKERDVPAFLDGFSESAKKAQTNVVDMQTQGFARVEMPKELQRNRMKTTAQRLAEVDEVKKDAQQELEEIITLAAMPIQIKLEGTFESILNFLVSLENYDQLLTASNVEITSKAKEYPVLNCAFTLKLYSLKSLSELRK